MVGFGADKKKGSKQKVKARNREREQKVGPELLLEEVRVTRKVSYCIEKTG